MKAKIRKFLEASLARNGDLLGFDDEESLIKSRRLDSLDIMDLTLFIEEEFEIPTDIVRDEIFSLDSLNSIVAFVESKKI